MHCVFMVWGCVCVCVRERDSCAHTINMNIFTCYESSKRALKGAVNALSTLSSNITTVTLKLVSNCLGASQKTKVTLTANIFSGSVTLAFPLRLSGQPL